jgi:flavin-binding protein dodecin
VASDAPSNPEEQALTAERESDRFEVVNTAPRIENLRAERGSNAKVTFDGISSAGAIGRAAYSVDGGDWQIVFPVGQLSDAAKETYQIQLANLGAGEHTVAVQISDRFENMAVAKVTLSAANGSNK